MNPVYKLLQSLPTNGWTTVIGGIGLIVFGISGLVTGKLDVQSAFASISAGITALGLGNKLAKIEQTVAAAAVAAGVQ